jgi:two-component system phosphate regulon sensor histidine kinase PhoR
MTMPGKRGGRRMLSRSLILATGLCVAAGALLALGYVATGEWQRNSVLAADRQAAVKLNLLTTALSHDMKAAQVSLLVPLEAADVAEDPPHDLRQTVARGLARFPYPEWFFVAHAVDGGRERTWLFTRADRPPPWGAGLPQGMGRHTVVMTPDVPALRELVGQLRRQPTPGRRFTAFESEIHQTRYQIVAVSLRSRSQVTDLAGFAVNLGWVRDHYFAELLDQVSRIGGAGAVSLAVLDEAEAVVANTGSLAPGASVRQRPFRLMFFDSAMTALLPPRATAPREWRARAGPMDGDGVLAAAARGARWTLGAMALAAVVSVIGMLVTTRTVRVRAELAAMKSDFVSTVTHELKAPLAVIRLAVDTLASGRYTSAEAIPEYARLASRETLRLSHQIDNLLTYARVSDVEREYRFEALEVAELVEDALERFGPRLIELGFETCVDVPLDLPRIHADRTAVLQAVGNLVDNAIKYSTSRLSLEVRGRAHGKTVRLEVTDRGRGIPEEELPRIFDRFYRGRSAAPGGSGLGLAIVSRVAADHGGRVDVESRVGEGTTVTLLLPAEGS